MLHAPNLRKHGIRSGPILSASYLNIWLDRAPPMQRWLEQTARKRETCDSCRPIVPYLVVGLEGFPLFLIGRRSAVYWNIPTTCQIFSQHLQPSLTVRTGGCLLLRYDAWFFCAECNTFPSHHNLTELLRILASRKNQCQDHTIHQHQARTGLFKATPSPLCRITVLKCRTTVGCMFVSQMLDDAAPSPIWWNLLRCVAVL
jgi:hypothetical protein